MDNEIKTVCTKCGGVLIPDQDHTIYRCTFCGVAFGSSILFDKDALSKAKDSQMHKEFNEADIWFSCVLMREPGNFDALLGRILCAGKWVHLYDLEETTLMSGVRIENVYDRIVEAIRNSSETDNPFFAQFRTVMNLYEEILVVDGKIKPLQQEKKRLTEARQDIYEEEEESEYVEKSLNANIRKVNSQIDPIMNKRKKLVHDFKVARQKLEGMKYNRENKEK